MDGFDTTSRTISGVRCIYWPEGKWTWEIRDVPWSLHLFGRILYRLNRTVFQDLQGGVAAAIAFSRGWEERGLDDGRVKK